MEGNAQALAASAVEGVRPIRAVGASPRTPASACRRVRARCFVRCADPSQQRRRAATSARYTTTSRKGQYGPARRSLSPRRTLSPRRSCASRVFGSRIRRFRTVQRGSGAGRHPPRPRPIHRVGSCESVFASIHEPHDGLSRKVVRVRPPRRRRSPVNVIGRSDGASELAPRSSRSSLPGLDGTTDQSSRREPSISVFRAGFVQRAPPAGWMLLVDMTWRGTYK